VPDTELNVRLDPLNPGQFFACCGLFELLSREEPGILSSFVFEAQRPRMANFCMQTSRGTDALGILLRRLRSARVSFSDHPDEAVQPAVIDYANAKLTIDWWLDEFRDKTTNIKCWAGRVKTTLLFEDLMPRLDVESTCEDLFDRSAPTRKLFGVDPRSAWNALDLGFSPNEHDVESTVFPAVEVLAAIGLQYFRPDSSNRDSVKYSLWKDPLPASIARLAFSAPWEGMPVVDLVFKICKRGQNKYFSFGRNAEKESTNQ
jgi:CRISPR-associated protein Csx14